MGTEGYPVGLLREQARLGHSQLAALAGRDLAEFDSLAAEREIISECLRTVDWTRCPGASEALANLRACDERIELHLIELNRSISARLSDRRAALWPRMERLYAYV